MYEPGSFRPAERLPASTTVGLTRTTHLPATNRSTLKAALVTPWSLSSSLTMARRASEERASAGLRRLRANVLSPEPTGAIKITGDSMGIVIRMIETLFGVG